MKQSLVKIQNYDQNILHTFSNFLLGKKWLKENGYSYSGVDSVYSKGENRVEDMVSMYEEETEINPYTHFYLYAKGWYYQSTNTMEDLRKIASHYSFIKPEYIEDRDIKSHLLYIAYNAITTSGNPEHFFQQFVANVEGGKLVEACLTLVRFEIVRDLGVADENVLPLSSEAIKHMKLNK